MRLTLLATSACGPVLGAPAARAHDSFAAIYDVSKPDENNKFEEQIGAGAQR